MSLTQYCFRALKQVPLYWVEVHIFITPCLAEGIHAQATVVGVTLYRGTPHAVIFHAWPVVIVRRKRSLVSSTRRHVIACGSMSRRANLHSQHYVVVPAMQTSREALLRVLLQQQAVHPITTP